MTDDRSPSEPANEEELRSAAALARALDGGPAEPDLPGEALETAALLRSSAGVERLSDERQREIRRELLESLPPLSRARRRRFSLPHWLVLALPLAGVAVLSLLVLPRSAEPPASSMPQRAEPAIAEGLALPSDRFAERSLSDDAPGAALGAAVEERPAATGRAPTERDRGTAPGRDEASKRARADVMIGDSSMAREAKRGAVLGGGSPVALGLPAQRSAANETAAAAPLVVEAPAAERAADDAEPPALREVGKAAGDRHVELLARVNDAKFAAAHAGLDAALDRNGLERSQRTLSHTLEALRGGLAPTDAHLAQQDLYCRLAEAALRLGEPQAALEWTRQGLDLDGSPTPFLAQLHAIEGSAWAALGDRTRAAGSYMRALRMHDTLLDESLDGR